MQKLFLKSLIIGLLTITPVTSQAAWSNWYPVSQVYTYSTGSVFLALAPTSAHPNPDGCASASWLLATPDQANVKEIYQMALTAKAAGLKVNVFISGCAGSYPKIHHLRIN